MAETATGLALALAGAFGVYQLWPKQGESIEPGQVVLLALAALGIVLGAFVLIAEFLAPPVGLLRALRDRRTKYPINAATWTPGTPQAEEVVERLHERLEQEAPKLPTGRQTVQSAEEIGERRRQRGELGRLRDEARRHVGQYASMSLDQLVHEHADEWVDTWTFEIRETLAPDVPGLARFDQPIDAVSGQDWRLRPVTMLRVRLTRLEAISRDEYWEGPTVEPDTADPDDPFAVTSQIIGGSE